MTNTMTQPRFEINVGTNLDSIKWGDIVYIDFTDNARNSEQSGIRPAIVIQNDKGNSSSPCTLVAPMTSEDKKSIPTHITVYPTKDSGLKKISTIMFEQTRVIDKSRILSKVGHLDAEFLIQRIENSIMIAFSKNFA